MGSPNTKIFQIDGLRPELDGKFNTLDFQNLFVNSSLIEYTFDELSTTISTTVKNLSITNVYVFDTYADLISFVGGEYTGSEFVEGDVIVLTQPTPDLIYIHNGGGDGNENDFTELEFIQQVVDVIPTAPIQVNNGNEVSIDTDYFIRNQSLVIDSANFKIDGSGYIGDFLQINSNEVTSFLNITTNAISKGIFNFDFVNINLDLYSVIFSLDDSTKTFPTLRYVYNSGSYDIIKLEEGSIVISKFDNSVVFNNILNTIVVDSPKLNIKQNIVLGSDTTINEEVEFDIVDTLENKKTEFLLRMITSAQTEDSFLFNNGTIDGLDIPVDSVASFKTKIVIKDTIVPNERILISAEGIITNDSGVLSFIDTPTTETYFTTSDSIYNVSFVIENDLLKVKIDNTSLNVIKSIMHFEYLLLKF